MKLDDKGGSEPAPYDLTILPENLSADNATFKRRDFGLSGWVVVTMRTLPNTPGKAYDVRVEQGYTQQYIPVPGHDVSQADPRNLGLPRIIVSRS